MHIVHAKMPTASSAASPRDVAVVVFPFVIQSHLNLLLDLSVRLSGRGLPVYYAAPSAHIRQVKSRAVRHWPPGAVDAIRFHELPLAPFPVLHPDPHSPTPNHILTMIEPYAGLQAPLASLLRDLSAAHSRVVVVHDMLGAFAAVEGSRLPNAVSYGFCSVSAAYLLAVELGAEVEGVLKAHGVTGVPAFDASLSEDFARFALLQCSLHSHVSGLFINSCRELDAGFGELVPRLPRYSDKKLFFVSPLRLTSSKQESSHTLKRHHCLDWLDEQPEGSVVYVSFGTTTTLADEQIEQMAAGLRRSGQRFIWVLRDADLAINADEYDEEGSQSRKTSPLPGYEEHSEETSARGMIVRGWAPQPEILAHAATGAFMSHCGWNSCLESLAAGVPLIAWPMHGDQPLNAALLTQRLKVGFMVPQGIRSAEEVVPAASIEEAITRVMVSDEAKEVRNRAKALGEAIREAASEGGSCHADLDAFIAHVTAPSAGMEDVIAYGGH